MSSRARALSLRPLATGLVLLLAAAALVLARPDPAAAAVTHLLGFRATVDGFTSWYGSYAMGELGTTWCIDHGIRSPDPAYRYVPADLSAVPTEVQSAMAWVVATHGRGTDRVAHAALMLALHDLMGAQYPSGRLDVDRLTSARLAGFGGAEGQVLSLARSIKADGLAHRGLRGPLRLTVEIGPSDTTGNAPVTARVADATGQGLAGVAISFEGSSAGLSAPGATTGAEGAVALTVRAGGAPATVQATATVPHLPLDAWAPTTTRAQRVARPIVDRLAASGTVAAATGQLRVHKVDAVTGASLAGASLLVRYDADADATFEQVVAEVTTAAEPTVLEELLPGRYEITETAAPAGYEVLVDPVVIDLAAGALAEAVLENQPVPPPTTTPPTTAVPAPTTAAAPTSPPTTTPPPTTTTTTTPPPPITVPAPSAPATTAPQPPATVLAAPPGRPTGAALPRTGVDSLTLGLFGAGVLLIGRSLLELGRPQPSATQPSAPRSRRSAMRSSS